MFGCTSIKCNDVTKSVLLVKGFKLDSCSTLCCKRWEFQQERAIMFAFKEDKAQLSLKVMINKEKDKVLFAEADSDFVDVLLSFLTLPLGKILKLQKKHQIYRSIGSLTSLYDGLSNLGSVYFLSEEAKQMLLNPARSLEAECGKLKLNLDDSDPFDEHLITYTKEIMGSTTNQVDGCSDGVVGVFTEKTMAFIISDDLRIVPIVQGSIIKPLSDIGITDIAKAEIKTVTLGLTQILNLVVECFCSDTPLTNVVIGKEHDYGRTSYQRFECLRSDLLTRGIKKEAELINSKKMAVKAVLKKSSSINWLLFVVAKEDFVDFLFSFLTLPLASVECLLDKDAAVLAVDNLYRSAARLNDDKNCQKALNKLMNPEHQPKFVSGKSVPEVYVKGPRMFMVGDDLTVTPYSLTSSLAVLNQRKIPLSDVEELEVQVGMEEILSILKASLMFDSALTEGLINPILRKDRN